jgi:protein-tyrosine-phosphatase
MNGKPIPVSRKGEGLRRALFLCEDNFRDSRFCEELFNSLVRDEGLNWQAISRAISAPAARLASAAMATDAVAALRARGAAPVNHRRLPLGHNGFDLETCHVVIAIRPAAAATPDPERAADAVGSEHWTIDAALPLAARYEWLGAAVRSLLDRICGREADAAEVVSASGKLASPSFVGNGRVYAGQQQRADSSFDSAL